MEIYVLASGSKGNMTYLKVGHIKLFVDAGISYKKIKEKMMNYGEDLNEVKTLLLTHEHSDHTIGLKMLLKHHVITDVYMTKGTMDGLAVDVKEMIPHIHVIKSEDHFKSFRS